jgi:hypothetical protein
VQFSSEQFLTVDDNIQTIVINYLSEGEWLMGRHIDIPFDYIEHQALVHSYINLTITNNCKVKEAIRNQYFFHESNTADKIFAVNVMNWLWIILANIDPSINQYSYFFIESDESVEQNWLMSTTAKLLRIFSSKISFSRSKHSNGPYDLCRAIGWIQRLRTFFNRLCSNACKQRRSIQF